MSLILGIPVAVILCIYVIAKRNSQSATVILKTLDLIQALPLLIYGVAFLYFMGATVLSVVLLISLLGVGRLSERWLQVSMKVRALEVETAHSLGMSFVDILYRVYLLRFRWAYLGHFICVCYELLWILTPFLCLHYYQGGEHPLISVAFFQSFGENLGHFSLLVPIIFLFHLVKHGIDRRVGYIEVSLG